MIQRISIPHASAAILAGTLSCGGLFADRVPYMKVIDFNREQGDLVVTHHHDWRDAYEFSTSKRSLPKEHAYIRVSDKKSGTELFTCYTPALSYVYISPDTKYIIGLSNIKLANPYQIIVISHSGKILFQQKVCHGTFPGVVESVTNWIEWYREPYPKISIQEHSRLVTLSIESNDGEMDRVFEFRQ